MQLVDELRFLRRAIGECQLSYDSRSVDGSGASERQRLKAAGKDNAMNQF